MTSVASVSTQHEDISDICFCTIPQWEAADAEIKIPLDENTELKGSPFKAWSKSVYSHACHHKHLSDTCLYTPQTPQ